MYLYFYRIFIIFNCMDRVHLGITQDLGQEHINFYPLLVSYMNFTYVHLEHGTMLIQLHIYWIQKENYFLIEFYQEMNVLIQIVKQEILSK